MRACAPFVVGLVLALYAGPSRPRVPLSSLFPTVFSIEPVFINECTPKPCGVLYYLIIFGTAFSKTASVELACTSPSSIICAIVQSFALYYAHVVMVNLCNL